MTNSDAPDIKVEITTEGIGRITFNRPEVANAVRPKTMREFCEAVDAYVSDNAVKAIVVTGEGTNFAAGADFAYLESLLSLQTESVNTNLYTYFKGAVERLWKSPKPTVAAVNGAAITVGCEIALACDARVASAHSRFGENWLYLGLMPPLGGAVLLPRMVGMTHAKRMILEAHIADGKEAMQIGLVDELVDDRHILARAEERALAMATFPPQAFASAKAALHRGFESTMEHEWVANVLNQAMLIGTEDFRQRVRSRLEAMKAKKKSEK